MGSHNFQLSVISENLLFLLQGLWLTLGLTIVSALIGLVAGFGVCLLATARFAPVRWLAVSYIELFRCTPALIQIIWIFYCVPIFLGLVLEPIPMAILALTLNITAFNAEAYRAALQAIPQAHFDASEALGLSSFTRTVFVMFPQAVITATPVLLNNTIGLLQQSALVSLVGLSELMYRGKIVATETYRPIEVFTAVALIYFLISLPISRFVDRLERYLTIRLK